MAKTTIRQAINNRIARYKVEIDYHKRNFAKIDNSLKMIIKSNQKIPFYNPIFAKDYITRMSHSFNRVKMYEEKLLEDERLLTYLDYNG